MGKFNLKEVEKKVFNLEKLEEKERKRNTSGRFNRFGAWFLDFNVERITISIIVLLIWLIVFRNFGSRGGSINIEGLPTNVQYITLAILFIFTLFYNIILPMYIYEGQTIGKKAIGIKIVKANGEKATLKNYILRYITILFIEGNSYVVTFSGVLFFFLNMRFEAAKQWNDYLFGIYALSALIAFFHKDRRAIHDFIGGTKVINIKVVEEYKPKVVEEIQTAE
ncbi:MAG: RDD family protein [Ignavibacteria bacterium]|nr:RDD family protein [Ignavibacteria bacterium]